MATTTLFHGRIYEETSFVSVDELFDTMRLSRVDLWGDAIPNNWVFRGQSAAAWGLVPGAWRADVLARYATQIDRIKDYVRSKMPDLRKKEDYNKTAGIADGVIVEYVSTRIFEEIILDEFEELLSDGGFAEALILHRSGWRNMLESGVIGALDAYKYNVNAVAIAQHSGIPTRLLDWTLDPLKALVFSLRDDESEQEIGIWAIDYSLIDNLGPATERISDGLPVIKFLKGRRFGNEFLNAQDGCFTYLDYFRPQYAAGSSFPELQDVLIGEAIRLGLTRTVIKKFTLHVSAADKLSIRRRLYRERKTLFHLMPSFERCADEAKSVIRLGVRDRIA